MQTFLSLLLVACWAELLIVTVGAFATVQLIAPKDAANGIFTSRYPPDPSVDEIPLQLRFKRCSRPLFATKNNPVVSTAAKGGSSKTSSPNRIKKSQPRPRHKRTTNRPYASYTTEELKQLTEYHLSKSITSNYSSASSQQLQEFAKLIASWSKLNTNNRGERKLAAEMSEQCLRELIEEKLAGNERTVNVMSADMYHSVIRAWLKTHSHVDLVHATSLLDLMERTHKGEDKISSQSIRCYATVMDGWCKSRYNGAEVKAEELLHRMRDRCADGDVNVRYYNNVMNRIAMSGKKNAGKEAERLLNVLIDAYNKGEKGMIPNRSTFNTVIKAYAKSPTKDAAKDARRILSMMEDPSLCGLENAAKNIEPDKVSCTSLLTAWANSGDRDAGEKAEQLLQRMEDMYSKGNRSIKPDTVTYNAVIKVW